MAPLETLTWSIMWKIMLFSQKCVSLFCTELKTTKAIIPVTNGSSEFPDQSLRQIGQGVPELWSDIQTNKQRLHRYIIFLFMLIETVELFLLMNSVLYKLYNTEEIEHNVWIFSLPPAPYWTAGTLEKDKSYT